MEGGIKLDRWGYEVKTTSDACISAINSYYEQVLTYGRKRRVILEAAKHDANCVLANSLAALFLASSDCSRAQQHLRAADTRLEEATNYERAVFDVISYLLSSKIEDDVAVEKHIKLLDDYPKDLVSLKRAQILCFYMGDPGWSLNLVEKVLPMNEHQEYIYGMLAFPLLEVGRMAEAAEAAKKGYLINNRDFWSQHAICHVLQDECRFKEAVNFMQDCSYTWTSCSSFMLTHNWWHVALCYLEAGCSITKVLQIYDDHIWKELESDDAIPAEVYLNALGLMLRLQVRGELEALGNRLKVLTERVSDKTYWHLECHLDLYIIWALSQAGDHSKAEDVINGLKSRIAKRSQKRQELMQRGILLAEAVLEYGKCNYERALELLGPAFEANEYKMVGASGEQLAVFDELWYRMLLNSGRAKEAVEVIEKRMKDSEGVPFLWCLLAEGYAITGRPEATAASNRAAELSSSYFP